MNGTRIAISLLFFCQCSISYANNGLNVIGFGAKSMALAGADVAIVDDTYSLNINPAGLSEIEKTHIDLYAGAIFSLDTGHKDQFGNDFKSETDFIPYGNVGFGRRINDSSITFGVGIFAQGGAGFEYSNLQTAFGTQDKISSLFRIARLNAGLSYELNKNTSLGISLITTYADAEQSFFPETSVFTGNLATSFFGFELSGLKSLSPAIKIGMQHKFNSDLTFGLAYSNESELSLDDGTLISNQTAIGNGKVTYRNASIDGYHIPQELNLALWWRANQLWDITGEISWLDWSKAMHSSTLTARNPDNGTAPPVLQQTILNEWQDQIVYAIAVQYHYSPTFTIRAGYNYGSNPIPDHRLNPALNTITEHHITFGTEHALSSNWQLHTAVEYIFQNKVTYTNPDLPFGTDAEERAEAISIHFTLAHQW